jgi:hypothetical protein
MDGSDQTAQWIDFKFADNVDHTQIYVWKKGIFVDFETVLPSKGLGSFERLLQILRNSETATPIHFKMPGLIPFVKW